MAKRQLPDPEILRQLLRYEPETGHLFWRPREESFFEPHNRTGLRSTCSEAWNRQYADRRAFTATNGYGYFVGHVLRRYLLAHRVIWAMNTGSWPDGQIDHIDHNRQNNVLHNLRDIQAQENQRNMCGYALNKSGRVGVIRRDNKWVAQIGHEGKMLRLGRFSNFKDACKARAAAEKRLGYHPNHCS